MQTLILRRQGSPVEIAISTQEIAANILDLICEAPDLTTVQKRREGDEIDKVVADIIDRHLRDSLKRPYLTRPTHEQPTFETVDLPTIG